MKQDPLNASSEVSNFTPELHLFIPIKWSIRGNLISRKRNGRISRDLIFALWAKNTKSTINTLKIDFRYFLEIAKIKSRENK